MHFVSSTSVMLQLKASATEAEAAFRQAAGLLPQTLQERLNLVFYLMRLLGIVPISTRSSPARYYTQLWHSQLFFTSAGVKPLLWPTVQL